MVRTETFPVQSMRILLEVHIKASPEQIFAALTTGIALWWGAGYLESRELARDLVLEPHLGGRFYESWEEPSTDKDGALLGHVIQIRKWQVLKIAGHFGMEDRCAHGVLAIRLRREQNGTKVYLQHDAVGDIDDGIRAEFTKNWQDLLNALRAQVEQLHSEGLRHDPALDLEP
jgi:uncharacterized protein YndB with AHSA1/START domain